jgi:hypothetical protein
MGRSTLPGYRARVYGFYQSSGLDGKLLPEDV